MFLFYFELALLYVTLSVLTNPYRGFFTFEDDSSGTEPLECVELLFTPSKRLCVIECQSQSYITTDSQSASPSWYQAPTWDPRPIFPILSLIIFLTVSGLSMWDAFSDEKSGLYFPVFSGHRQRSLSQI
jgi:hypothetical protein